MRDPSDSTGLHLRIGPEELIIRQRYEIVSIANDILIAAWFIVGSVMFFSSGWTRLGTWFFLLGSIELLIRPVIRLFRLVHLQSIRAAPEPGPESSQDY